MSDLQYQSLPTTGHGIAHQYGPRVHLMSNAHAMSMLARVCKPTTVQPEVNHLVASLYDQLIGAVSSHLLRRVDVRLATRMAEFTEEGFYHGEIIDPTQRVVVVDIARAGILPSHRFYEGLHHIIEPSSLRAAQPTKQVKLPE